MNNTWTQVSNEIADAVDAAAPSIVQVHGHRRPAAGVVFAENHVLTPAATDDDKVAVNRGDGEALEGAVLGRIPNMGLTVVRVDGLGRKPLTAADEPRPGHLAVAIGRTWSGGVMAAFAPVAVVGGPLRTGRATTLDRVIRIQQAPHGALTGGALIDASGRALGIITSTAIRGTTVVIPATIAWAAATRAGAEGGTRQGYLGVSSLAVALPERQRGGKARYALLSQVAAGSPAETGGLLVGDLIVAFDGEAVQEPEDLLTRLRGDRVGKAVPITVIEERKPTRRPSRLASGLGGKLAIVPSRIRVFLNGRTAADVDGLRRRLADDPNIEIVDRIDRAEMTISVPPSARPIEPLVEALTVRERDVLALVADGLPNREIAGALGISEHTVKFHLASIFGKFGVSTRTEAVQRGLRLGVIEI